MYVLVCSDVHVHNTTLTIVSSDTVRVYTTEAVYRVTPSTTQLYVIQLENAQTIDYTYNQERMCSCYNIYTHACMAVLVLYTEDMQTLCLSDVPLLLVVDNGLALL